MTKEQIAQLIRSFVDGSCGEWAWDDFTSVRQSDNELEEVRQRILKIPDKYPSTHPNVWTNDEGIQALLEIAEMLSPK